MIWQGAFRGAASHWVPANPCQLISSSEDWNDESWEITPAIAVGGATGRPSGRASRAKMMSAPWEFLPKSSCGTRSFSTSVGKIGVSCMVTSRVGLVGLLGCSSSDTLA